MSSRTSLTPETFLRAGQRVFVGGSSNEPAGLLARLQAAELPTDLHFLQFPNPAYNSTDFTALNPTTQLSTFFMTPALKQAPVERLHYLPMHMRRVFDYLRTDVDVALKQTVDAFSLDTRRPRWGHKAMVELRNDSTRTAEHRIHKVRVWAQT